jgi:preprotein translocase subunit YajC
MNLFDKLLGISTAVAETAATTVTDPAMAADELGAAGTVVGLIGSLLPMILIFVVFYFMLIRPQRKKDKQVKDMLAALKHGDRVCTIGGIYGTITAIKDDTIVLETGNDRTKIQFEKWAIQTVHTKHEDPIDDDDDDDDDDI